MIGKEISHYKILEKIGQGGMGEVYLAMDTRLQRKVALKFLPDRFTLKKAARERFNREARAAAALSHPNIVTVYEIDEFEGLIYMAMEYVAGQTVAEKLELKDDTNQQKTAPIKLMTGEEIISITLEVCKGLREAHRAEIVHRDIKLENIMVDIEGRVKILDFGLARLKGVSRLTEESVTMGTAFYMSPEQLRGDEFDHRTDIWSLGVVMYLMAVGKFPFQGETAMDTMFAIMQKEQDPVTEINKDIPKGLQNIIDRCLQKEAGDRYQDLTGLIEDLERVVQGETVTGAPAVRQQRTRGKLPFNLSLKTALPILLVLLSLALFLLAPGVNMKVKKWLGFHILPDQKQVALLPLKLSGDESSRDHALCDGLAEHFTRNLVRIEHLFGDLMVIPGRKIQKENITSIEDAFRFFNINLAITGKAKRSGERVLLTLDLSDARKERSLDSREYSKHLSELCDFQEQVVHDMCRMLEKKPGPEMRELVALGCTRVPGAYENYLRGLGNLKEKKDPEKIEQAIRLFKRAIEIDIDYALAYAGLAEAYFLKYLHTRDEQWAELALIEGGRAIKKENRLSDVHVTLGKVYYEEKKFPEANQACRRALEIEPNNAEALYLVARTSEKLDKLEEAEKGFQKATTQRPLDFSTFNNLGNFYMRHNQMDEALEAFHRMEALNPRYSTGLINMGILYFFKERRNEARDMFERTLAIKPTYTAYVNLGTLYYFQGLYDLAVQRFEKALEIQDNDFYLWGYLAESYYWLEGDGDNARVHYTKAVELAQKALERDTTDHAILANLAFYHARLGDHNRSLRFLEEVLKSDDIQPKEMLTVANTYEQLGEREKALEWVNAALAKKISLAEFDSRPGLGELRKDPRFLEILEVHREEQGQTVQEVKHK